MLKDKINSHANAFISELKNANQQQWLTFLGNSLLIVITYSLVKFFLYSQVLSFVVYDSWVSWYWPVGCRLALMVILPFRYWPALLLGGGIGAVLMTVFVYDNSFADKWQATFYFFSPLIIVQHIAVIYLKLTLNDITISKLFPALKILAACTFFRICSSAELIINNDANNYYGTIPDERKFEMILAHFLGGFISIVMFIPLVFLLRACWQHRDSILVSKVLQLISQLLLMVATVIVLYQIQPHTLYLLKVLTFLPLVWFSYRFGWWGAINSSLTINGLIIVSVYGVNDTQLLVDNELYIITIAIAGTLLGALMAEQQSTNQTLVTNNQLLQGTNKALTELSLKNQQLANKLVFIQENERRKLSHELHDEVGQTITALKTELKILQRELKNTLPEDSFNRINTGSDRIYDSVYRVMNWLRPRVLDDLGLHQSLSGDYFRLRLKQEGIDYHCQVIGDIDSLSEKQSITLFRITQECVSNCIRHANAKNFHLTLCLNDHFIHLNIQDDGQGIQNSNSSQNSGGFGLTGIEERVNLLGGKYNLMSNKQSFELKISLPLVETSQQNKEAIV